MSRSDLERRGQKESNADEENLADPRTASKISSTQDWVGGTQDRVVRERAYRDYLSGLRAQFRERTSSQQVDIRILKQLSSKNGVTLAWYLFKVALPVLEADLG